MARISEIKTIKVQIPTCPNPVYLRWKNLEGGYDYWLFDINQRSVLNTESTGNFRRNYDTLSEQRGVLSVLRKQGREGLTVTAYDLTQNEVETIRKIGLSPRVDMLVSWEPNTSPVLPPVWKEVLVPAGSIGAIDTANSLHRIVFDIALPEFYTIPN